MLPEELQTSVIRRSTQLAVTIRQYLDGNVESRSVHALLSEIVIEAEIDERWNLPLARGEEALWSLVWSAQHLCSPSHPIRLARQALEPHLQAVEQGKPLPFGTSSGRPRGAA